MLETILNLADSLLGSAWYFPIVLLGVGLFFTVYLGFPQIRFFRHAWGVLSGRYTSKDAPGDTNHFQALATALSGTVGTGNIGGVAFAIFLGGPAALFWMWITAVLGMTTKFVEVTVSHKYRKTDAQGAMSGGPMYYMEHGLKLKWLAVFFAAATVISSFGTGSLPQSNNMAAGLEASFAIPPMASGAVFAVLLGLVILGGISRIAKVAATLVPLMGVLYALGALAVVASNIDNLVPAFLSVFADAFTGSAATGGFLGASFAYAFNRGVNRGLFSNEAGQGSAPIAHAAAKTDEPVAAGMVAILEPFIDTLIICTLTGMVILSSGVWNEKFETEFSTTDTLIISGVYEQENELHRTALGAYLNNGSLAGAAEAFVVVPFTGTLQVVAGQLQEPLLATVIHNRSIAEAVRVANAEGGELTGTLTVAQGKLVKSSAVLSGRSLLHSVPLTIQAFKRSFLGTFGEHIVSIGLAMFAFSTALAWSYYGDRAMTYLFGSRSVLPYRLLYILGFFLATIVDTSLIWLISAVTIALMTLPNLVGIFLLRREVKQMTGEYWSTYKDTKK